MFHLDSIQNIFISKSILNNNKEEENVHKFLSLFEEKTKRQLIKRNVLGISFLKSLFLTSKYDSQSKYDCNLTLFFIRKNVHFNFKTETEIFDYFNQCSLISIKNTTLNDSIY